MTSVIVSGIIAFQYMWVVEVVLEEANWRYPPFVKKDAALKLTDQESTVVAISSLIAVFCITEVALAVCAAWISDSLLKPPQENQVSQVCQVIYLLGTRQIKLSYHGIKNFAS